MKFLCYGKIFQSSHFFFSWACGVKEDLQEVENNFHPTRQVGRLEHGEGAGFLHGHTAAKAAVVK